MKERRTEYDVSNQVRVSDPRAVHDTVSSIYCGLYPHAQCGFLKQAFHDFDRLFRGEYPGFHGCETRYHDLQHSLDMTLAMARLIQGHEQTVSPAARLGDRRAAVGILSALYHDAGYFRRTQDFHHVHGAEYTPVHVRRSARFLAAYLPRLGFADEADTAALIVHYTGYEVDPDAIRPDDERFVTIGHMLGTADLIAQMSDRCYLEKCRDRLFEEFSIGGVPGCGHDPAFVPNYGSAQELLARTPVFYDRMVRLRLDRSFGGVHRYARIALNGLNLYLDEMAANLRHLEHILETGQWNLLRRRPPVFTAETLGPSPTAILAAAGGCPASA